MATFIFLKACVGMYRWVNKLTLSSLWVFLYGMGCTRDSGQRSGLRLSQGSVKSDSQECNIWTHHQQFKVASVEDVQHRNSEITDNNQNEMVHI